MGTMTYFPRVFPGRHHCQRRPGACGAPDSRARADSSRASAPTNASKTQRKYAFIPISCVYEGIRVELRTKETPTCLLNTDFLSESHPGVDGGRAAETADRSFHSRTAAARGETRLASSSPPTVSVGTASARGAALNGTRGRSSASQQHPSEGRLRKVDPDRACSARSPSRRRPRQRVRRGGPHHGYRCKLH